MNSGYSGTPLAKKLGIKDGMHYALHNPPQTYTKWFDNLDLNLFSQNVRTKESTDFAHVFCITFEDLKNALKIYKPMLKKNGMVWVSWPKGSSKIKTDLKRDMIRDYILVNGLVDVKVAAIDENWSGLKFVYRLKDRT